MSARCYPCLLVRVLCAGLWLHVALLAGCGTNGSSSKPPSDSLGCDSDAIDAPAWQALTCTHIVSVAGGGEECSQASPCALADITQNAHPGDVVCLQEGDYGELSFNSASAVGTEDGWIVYRSAGDAYTARFQFITFDGTKKDAYLRFAGIRVDPGYVATSRGMAGVINLKGANHVWFDECQLEGEKIAGAPQTALAPYVFNESKIITAGVNPGDASFIRITGCTLRYAWDDLFAGEDSRSQNHVESWIITGNDFSRSGNDHVNLNGSTSGHHVARNFFHDQSQYTAAFCWTGAPTGDWTGRTWQTVTQDETGASAFFYKMDSGNCAGASGQVFWVLADDPDHLPSRNTQDTWRLDADPTNVFFQPSTTGDNGHVDMLTFQGPVTDVVVECNRFEDSKYGSQIIKLDPLYSEDGHPQRIVIRNNLLYRVEETVGYLILASGGKDVDIYNNLIDAGGNLHLQRAMRINSDFAATMTLRFYNNIVSGAVFSKGAIESNYNLWFVDPPAEFNEGSSSLVIADYDTVVFRDRSSADYQLIADSPAIDHGSPEHAAVTDINGVTRTNPDIGPYEWVQ